MSIAIGPSVGVAIRRVLGSVASIAALVVVLGQPAAASGEATAAEPCAVTHYGVTGYRICGFHTDQIDRGDGNIEYFVVGTDYAIWHIWKNTNAWHSLGGQARPTGVNGVYAYGNAVDSGVQTRGLDGNYWCIDWPWTAGWRLCG